MTINPINFCYPAGTTKSESQAKYLSLKLNNKLNMATYLKSTEVKAARSVGIISKSSYFLRQKNKIKIFI